MDYQTYTTGLLLTQVTLLSNLKGLQLKLSNSQQAPISASFSSWQRYFKEGNKSQRGSRAAACCISIYNLPVLWSHQGPETDMCFEAPVFAITLQVFIIHLHQAGSAVFFHYFVWIGPLSRKTSGCVEKPSLESIAHWCRGNSSKTLLEFPMV